ncbi:1-acyl-sn-glycerol-3-phosphate acyltransferase [Pararhizobium sp. IMCC21322]|uniref:lysophospholipid acyltransferase family protein n=1 Tax=Pararhizobium sp. IMCC21322 TaxID=3067903 RepID=UPI0027422A5B|nr:lysophospholipid acyltransferase family protein [Pararhizobium sp. IMCC21322]
MIYIRSVIFNLAFYTFLFLLMLFALPIFLLPWKWVWWMPTTWARTSLWMLRVLAGVKFELRGMENKPEGGVLIASKHQSTWETFVLLFVAERPAYLAKRELFKIPFFGWYLSRFRQISVNRARGSSALKSLIPQARAAVKDGRDVVIFPEGTRRTPGDSPSYKYGVTALYRILKVPVVPVALNAGVFWPRRTFLRYPGTIVMEILPPIEPGLSDDVFNKTLIERIETASDKLLEEARASQKANESSM